MFAQPPAKPLIAAVEGYAVGGGFELCLACDLIVAASSAKFGLPEVRHNVVAVGGGLFRLPRRIPYHLAMELALSGMALAVVIGGLAGIIAAIRPRGLLDVGVMVLATLGLRPVPTQWKNIYFFLVVVRESLPEIHLQTLVLYEYYLM